METILFYQGKRNEEIKYTPFYPINSDWIKLFKEKTNYNNSHHIIRTNNITKNNYSNKLNYFKFIKFDECKQIYPLNEIKLEFKNKEYNIYKDYELINPETYNILINFFGKQDEKHINELNVIKLDEEYILIKYEENIVEIIKIYNEKERYVIIGEKDISNKILELLNMGFNNWIKDNQIDIKNESEEIYERRKVIGMFYSFQNKENDINKFK